MLAVLVGVNTGVSRVGHDRANQANQTHTKPTTKPLPTAYIHGHVSARRNREYVMSVIHAALWPVSSCATAGNAASVAQSQGM